MGEYDPQLGGLIVSQPDYSPFMGGERRVQATFLGRVEWLVDQLAIRFRSHIAAGNDNFRPIWEDMIGNIGGVVDELTGFPTMVELGGLALWRRPFLKGEVAERFVGGKARVSFKDRDTYLKAFLLGKLLRIHGGREMYGDDERWDMTLSRSDSGLVATVNRDEGRVTGHLWMNTPDVSWSLMCYKQALEWRLLSPHVYAHEEFPV